jgi:cystathionine beta-synthase
MTTTSSRAPSASSGASAPLAPIFGNVLEMVGNTPMLRITRIDTGPCELYVKLESLNPGNSIKDRIAVSMVEAAEREGTLKPGSRIIEATAGNTGIALALVAGQKGYHLTVVVPDKMSDEKISHLRAMGAEVVLTRSDVGKGHPEYYQDIAERIAKETGAFYVNQFCNKANPDAHYRTTGPEIWNQMDGRIDAFVAGVGSGGTVSGVGRYLKEKNPACEIILADPAGSILTPLINENRRIEPGSWLVEGIGEDFVPDILDLTLVTKGYTVTDGEAFVAARELLRKEGILAGSSVGTLFSASLRYCREQKAPKRVVSLICDNGAKYLSKMYNDFWMVDNGFIDRPKHGDLRDLIARRHLEREDFTMDPDTPIAQAIKRMRMFGVSQMVVIRPGEKISGILDESDILMALMHDGANARRPVRDFMTSRLETIRPNASINDLVPIFRADRVAIVADEQHFYGIITKIDMINFLRKQLP